MRRLVGGILILVISVWGMVPITPATDELVVQEVSANGSRNLRPFTVKDRWEIRWRASGSVLTITVRHPDGKLAAVGGSADKPGTGSSYQPKGGTYFLDVMGIGDWTVTVVQLP